MTLVSVIVPVYNVEKTLNRAIESIIKQSSDQYDLEIILVNDGSTDSSSTICEDWASKCSEIVCYHKENGGLSSARNYGLKKASGSIISFLDSDDYFMDNTFFQVIPFFIENEIDIAVFGIEKGSLTESTKLTVTDRIIDNKEKNIEQLFTEKAVDFYAWNKIYRSTLFKEIAYPEGKLYEDVMPTYQLVNASSRISYHSIVGIFYFQNPDSIVYQHFNSKQYDNIDQRKILLNSIRIDYPQLLPLAISKLADGYLSTGYKITSVKGNETEREQYLTKIRHDIKNNEEKIVGNKAVPLTKRMALRLLLMNGNLYNRLYKLVLKK
ncbi:glycosyltransferase family 2 protein [Vagococcus sp. BWB3-3]|uniref:Glycosyltransferase family 2 protein n=1 Tax=Vagococcus allomyrinae TaxID=2794353 RepID=A0A940PGS6_9ENTE|nr:glycosyltransferase family 2 protein [Vagococcus allomyrinae]MBP1043668.1 glycosyltransferase family 2 protein [Vagococcus allomyrinae]